MKTKSAENASKNISADAKLWDAEPARAHLQVETVKVLIIRQWWGSRVHVELPVAPP